MPRERVAAPTSPAESTCTPDETPTAHGIRSEATFTTTGPALAGAAVIADITVDTATGVVTVDHVLAVHDSGRILDPARATGQVIGGVLQGVGIALLERTDTSGSHPARGFLDHLVPTAADRPDVTVHFVEHPQPDTPTGAKGLGEITVMAVPAAILNAIADATGARPTMLPATAGRVLLGISSAQR